MIGKTINNRDKKFTVFCALTLIMFFAACSQWKLSTLTKSEILFIENGAKAGQIALQYDDFALTDLSFGIEIANDKIYSADNTMHRIQVLSEKGEVELVLGDLKNINEKTTPSAAFKFGYIGRFTADSAENIYVQNRLVSDQRKAGNRDFSPSYVVVFDKKGKLQYTLGERGLNDTPFYHIESLFVDDNERLFVVSRSFDTWHVYRFSNKKQDFSIDLSTLNLKEKDGGDELQGQIDNVKVYKSGDMLLVCVAYYGKDRRLKYNKVFDYSVSERKIIREIMTLPDPKNVLFAVVDEKSLYFWNISGDDIKLMICNMEGHIMNNIHLGVGDTKYLYFHILSDSSGRIFSYQATKKGISISEWN